MSYQVLARKWRPGAFGDMVGQEHVLRALTNALDQDRLHHAYLFTGTRGVGKTTVARIFARCLNCEQGVSATPCGECASCREIAEGRFIDLIEVDAASRTKVEDTRELLENVQYAPTRGRYKVYLIDEVHMLSAHSFNALLKTLEEPPPHVKFLLATTDPQRLPVTVLSRCLQFNLKRLPAAMITAHLTDVMSREGLESEPAALQHLARAADGSMRDALSLLDQAIGYGGGRVCEADVRAMLGSIERGHAAVLLEAVAAADGQLLLERIEQLAQQAPDFGAALADLISLLQRVALAQVVPAAVEADDEDGGAVQRLAAAMSPEDVQLYYQIALHGRRDLPLAPDPRGGFEMVLLRMLAFRPGDATPAAGPEPASSAAAASAGVRAALGSGAPPAAAPARPRSAPTLPPAPPPAPAAPAVREPANAAPAPEPAAAAPAGRAGALPPQVPWSEVVAGLGIRGAAHQLAVNCAVAGLEGDDLRLVLDPGCAQLRSRNLEERLQQAVQQYCGRALRLSITCGVPPAETPAQERSRRAADRRQAAVAAIDADPGVSALRERFNARVQPESIQPVDDPPGGAGDGPLRS
jgi:DNA polymerase III subunit gamma/tau